MTLNRSLFFAFVAGTLAPTVLMAAGPDLLKNPFYVSLGTFIVNTDTKVQLDGETTTGTDVNLEQTFGDDTANRFRIDAYWRYAERHKVRAFGFRTRVKRSATISEQIDWGDVTFPVGADVALDRKFSIYELAYEYAFLRKEKIELSASAGLHWTTLSVNLAANLDDPNNPGETFRASDTGRLDVPLPVFGFRGLYTPGHNFWIDATAQIFSLTVNEYSGHVTDLRLAGTWQPKKWLGIGVGYNEFNLNVDVDKDTFHGSAKWTYKGPQVFLSGSF